MLGLSEGSSLGGRWIHRGRGQKTILSKMLQREICSAVQLLFSAHRPQGGWDYRPEVDGTRSGLAPRVLQMYRLRDHPGQQEGNQVLPNHGAKKGAFMRRLQPKKKRLRRFTFSVATNLEWRKAPHCFHSLYLQYLAKTHSSYCVITKKIAKNDKTNLLTIYAPTEFFL